MLVVCNHCGKLYTDEFKHMLKCNSYSFESIDYSANPKKFIKMECGLCGVGESLLGFVEDSINNSTINSPKRIPSSTPGVDPKLQEFGEKVVNFGTPNISQETAERIQNFGTPDKSYNVVNLFGRVRSVFTQK